MMKDQVVVSIGYRMYALPHHLAKERKFIEALLWFAETARSVRMNADGSGYILTENDPSGLCIAFHPAVTVSEDAVARDPETAAPEATTPAP